MNRSWMCALRICLALACAPAFAQGADTSAANLVPVLRESPGASRFTESLSPIGKVRAQLRDGSEVEIEGSWFHYLGDMHVRLVFDGETSLQMASPDDLLRLDLSPEKAVQRAVENLRQRYGEPEVKPLAGGMMQVLVGSDPDFTSSYFLDRAFWQALARDYPQGIVAAVPQRGGLIFAPADDPAALMNLQFSAVALFTAADRMRVSSALYRFTDGHWTVFQPPQHVAASD